ncbi:hypothetical protein P3489_06000 [Vibrio parahaemolyticus]|nr:hypothetical protein [Vibrio parahaemolyticus]
MSSFPDLLTSFEEAVEALKVKLSQDASSSINYNGEQIQSIAKDIDDKWAAIQALVDTALVFETKSLMDVHIPVADENGFYPLAKVWRDPVEGVNGLYGWAGTEWEKSSIDLPSSELDSSEVTRAVNGLAVTKYLSENVMPGRSKNMINPNEIRRGYYYSPSNNAIVSSTSYRCSGFIAVEEGETYTLSGGNNTLAAYATSKYDQSMVGSAGGKTFTVPVGQGIKYVVCNITNSGQDDTTYDLLTQLEKGEFATEIAPYRELLLLANLERGDELALQSEKLDSLVSQVFSNLFDSNLVDFTRRYSPGSLQLVSVDSNPMISSGYIKVEEGKTYTVSGSALVPNVMGGFFASTAEISAVEAIVSNAVDGGYTFYVPTGKNIQYVVFNCYSDAGHTELLGQIQLDEGVDVKPWQPYQKTEVLSPAKFAEPEDFGERFIFESASYNLIDESMVDFDLRYSTGNTAMVIDTLGIAASAYIPVKEGEWYTASGVSIYGQGGYFSDAGDTESIENIDFVTPVTGAGVAFNVPTGRGIKYVVLSLHKEGKDPAATSLAGPAQLEMGEMATDYRPYKKQVKIKEELLPKSSSSGSVQFDDRAWYSFVGGEDSGGITEKIPEFSRHWLAKDKDLLVVGTGTSLTARSSEHCTAHQDASTRPPLMHSNNFASIMWDKMVWEGQQYRRYDSGLFVENVSFSTASSLAEWDDGPYRAGLTRYSDLANAAVGFGIPANAWQFNFIYRTDSLGCEQAQVVIAEGDNQVEVFDEATEAWIEANGYVFSQRESAPVVRSVMVPRASTGEMVARDISTKANTTYQKRLKMRCKSALIDSRSTAKSVSVTAISSGRFMYWGVEWSVREHMITYVNAARGSHNTQADSTSGRGLPLFADNEVHGFKPDLLFFELPIHNDGASNASPYPGSYWQRLTDHFVFSPTYELSLKTRAENFGYTPEIAMFTASISWNFNGINDDGSLKIEEQDDGKMMSALDKYAEAYLWVKDNHPEAVCIHAAQRWVDAGNAIFGDLRTATEGSGKNGSTFTNEGSHWNDTGCLVMAKVCSPLFRFEK